MQDSATPKDIKKDSEILAEVYRNAQLGLTSIADILPFVKDGELKEEILREHEEYERICSEAANLARIKGIELKEPGAMKKAMMWMGINMKADSDGNSANIAAMMIKGTVNGITCLKTSYTESEKVMDAEIKKLLKDLIDAEEDFEKKLKKFL